MKYYRDYIVKLLDDESLRVKFSEILDNLCAVVMALNSEQPINVQEYKQICLHIYRLILETFPWARISPSLHKMLAHSYIRIRDNNSKGLGNESEEGIEATTKFLRKIRSLLARTQSEFVNLIDTFNHRWQATLPSLSLYDKEAKESNRGKVLKKSPRLKLILDKIYNVEE